MANYRDYGFLGVVPKPYGTQELVLALTEVSSSGPELQADLADRCVSNPAREIHPST